MTLEGEYYAKLRCNRGSFRESQSSWHWKANITDQRIIPLHHDDRSQSSWHWKANITRNLFLSGLHNYPSQSSWHWKANITLTSRTVTVRERVVAILMTLEGEYYDTAYCIEYAVSQSQSSWHWKANITCRSCFFLFFSSVSQSSWHWKANITHYSQHRLATFGMSQSSWHWKANITQSKFFGLSKEDRRNPHDIGRRILRQGFFDGDC